MIYQWGHFHKKNFCFVFAMTDDVVGGEITAHRLLLRRLHPADISYEKPMRYQEL
jgi:hypothetical protein